MALGLSLPSSYPLYLSTCSPSTSSSIGKVLSLPSLISSFHGIRIQRCAAKALGPHSLRENRGGMLVRAAKREEELKELRDRTTEELNEEVIDLKGELFMLRLQRSARNEFKSSEFRRMRKREKRCSSKLQLLDSTPYYSEAFKKTKHYKELKHPKLVVPKQIC